MNNLTTLSEVDLERRLTLELRDNLICIVASASLPLAYSLCCNYLSPKPLAQDFMPYLLEASFLFTALSAYFSHKDVKKTVHELSILAASKDNARLDSEESFDNVISLERYRSRNV